MWEIELGYGLENHSEFNEAPKLAQYVQAAARAVPSLASKKVSPHTFRHAAAVHLVAAGVDVTVIRSWLGHVHLDTTNHYAQANLDTK